LITFAGSGASSAVVTVKVENLMTGATVDLAGNDILHLTGTVGIYSIENKQSAELKIYPNPMIENSLMEVYPPVSGDAVITVFDITGKQLSQTQSYLEKSMQEFRLSGFKKGLYIINVRGDRYQISGRFLSAGQSNGTINIEKVSNNIQPTDLKKFEIDSKGVKGTVNMVYTTGDRLKFTGVSGNYSTIMTDIPASDKTITFNFIACTDGDNNNYPVVQIGTQTWMAKNLKTIKFNDGSSIPLVEGVSEWVGLTTPGYCWYNNNKVSYGDIYGALYNWYAVSTTTNGGKNVCPVGWHVPSDAEWKQLEIHLGMSQSDAEKIEWRGTNEGGKLKETGYDHWESPNTGADNSSGFTALPGGYRWSDGYFVGAGSYSLFWSDTEYNATFAWKRTLRNMYSGSYRYYNPKAGGFSVRCTK